MHPLLGRMGVSCLRGLLAGVVLSACSPWGALKPDEGMERTLPREITLTLSVAERVNPTAEGKPSPIMVRLFELADNAQFSSADYFALIGQGGVPLGKEMLTTEEYVLMPGEAKVMRKRLMPTSRYLGVVAGYSRLNGRVWRAIAPLPAPYPAGQEQGRSASPARRLSVMLRERGVFIREERPESGGKPGNDSN